MTGLTEQHDNAADIARNRLKGFAVHLLIYFVMMAVLIPVNLFGFPETVWFVFPLVAWGSLLAIHVAYVMGLFGKPKSS